MANNSHSDGICPICQTHAINDGKPLKTKEDILAYLKHFRTKKQEYFVCLSLDSGQKLISCRIVTIGLLDVSLVHPREVFTGPIADCAATVIVAHNHPSGDPTPSREDIRSTQQLVAASQILGIPLCDHIIIAANSHYSFRQHGMI